jgi:putative two-component system response regulator
MSESTTDESQQRTVLVVDDTKENLTVIGQLLRPFFHVRVANSGQRALEIVEKTPLPDLILLDVMMPEMDGYEVLRALQKRPQTQNTPVIFVTAMDADEDEERGLTLGAVDYVTKPIKPALLLARVRAHIELKAARDRLSDQNAYLDAEVRRRMSENELIKDFSLHALATLAEKRDNETGNHLHRTQAYVRALIDRLRDHPRFQVVLGDADLCDRIAKAAPLHDIGKVGIPDAILLKPGKLTTEEFEIMKTHANIGAQAIGDAIRNAEQAHLAQSDQTASRQTVQSLDFLETTRQIAGSHHEKWDGSGYPQGLSGEAIPLPARLMALADVFDALVSKRHYKQALPLPEAVRIMTQGRGRHFDPDIFDAFIESVDTFTDIAQRYADHPTEPFMENTP